MFDGIIFDVDGTLWDSTPVVEKAWNQAFFDIGIKDVKVTADQLKGLFGLHMDEIIKRLLPNQSEEKRKEAAPFVYSYEHDYLQETPGICYPDLEDVLKYLSEKYPLYIVSNCQAGYIELFYEKTGFGKYFKDKLCPGDSGLLKADNIKLIAKRNGVNNPVYIGDTQMDADACKDAGVPIIFASYGFGKVKEPDYMINSLRDLEKIL